MNRYERGLQDGIKIGERNAVRHGYWKPAPWFVIHNCDECSVCGLKMQYGKQWPYCPHCGAKMDEHAAEE